ncbi:MAG: hypothetical protein R3B41_01930 [Candidatus Doudnabacteria bacterium]
MNSTDFQSMNTQSSAQNCAVLFGGTGFIGGYLALELLAQKAVESIVLVDIKPPQFQEFPQEFKQQFDHGVIKFMQHDITQPIPQNLVQTPKLIANLAAVHREPGHLSYEYCEQSTRYQKYL